MEVTVPWYASHWVQGSWLGLSGSGVLCVKSARTSAVLGGSVLEVKRETLSAKGWGKPMLIPEYF